MYMLNANQIEQIIDIFGKDKNAVNVLVVSKEIGELILEVLALETREHVSISEVFLISKKEYVSVYAINLEKVLRDMTIERLEEYLERKGYIGKIKPLKVNTLPAKNAFSSFYYFKGECKVESNRLLITHGNCLDGYISKLIVKSVLKIPDTNIIDGLHTETFKDIAERISLEKLLEEKSISELYFTDYFIKETDYDYFLELVKKYPFQLTVVDHHATNEEIYQRFVNDIEELSWDDDYKHLSKFDLYFNMDYSAALLCYFKYVLGLTNKEIDEKMIIDPILESMPRFVKYVHENDTWKFTNHKESKAFGVAINLLFRSKHVIPNDKDDHLSDPLFSEASYTKAALEDSPEHDNSLAKLLTEELIKYGNNVLEIRNSYIDTVMDTATKHFIRVNDKYYRIAIVNANSVFTSDIGNKLISILNVDATICWCMDKFKVKVGIRATDFDTTIISKHFGGGGHKLASGCKFDSLEQFTNELYLPLLHDKLEFTVPEELKTPLEESDESSKED